jgi:N,N'-diacetylchitobiose phosphorylase
MTRSLVYNAHVLSNGSFATLTGPRGGGYAALDGLALTRWTPDPTTDEDGLVIYVRDLDTGVFWTANGAASEGYSFAAETGRVSFCSIHHDIRTSLDVLVAGACDAELRRLTLHNDSGRIRRLDVTTCAELALNTIAADAAHPAFSRLFVQTEHVPAQHALLAWRRLRGPDDAPLHAVHALVTGDVAGADGAAADAADEAEFETDRALFIGRGRSRAAPAALECSAPLGRNAGNVLDPLLSLRRRVTLRPGDHTTLTSVLGAAATREDALGLLRQIATTNAVTDAFAELPPVQGRDGAAPCDVSRTLGLPTRWRDVITIADPRKAVTAAATAATAAELEPGSSAARSDAGVHDEAAAAVAEHPAAGEAGNSRSLRFFNGWGGFSEDGSEYVILLPRTADGVRRPPLPWVNVLANEEGGCIVSEAGAVHTWTSNSRENRLTPWFNDPVTDRHGEALYVRDDDDGRYWSPTPGPRPGEGAYEARHGFGCTVFHHESRGLDQEVAIFVPVDAPARIARVRITNRTPATRRLSVYSYAQLVLGAHEADTRGRVRTWHDAANAATFAVQPERGEFSHRVAFASSACTAPGGTGWTTDRQEFLRSHGTVNAPAAVAAGTLGGVSGTGHDPCTAACRSFAIAPGETVSCVFVLGEAVDESAARRLVDRFRDPVQADRALEAVRAAWTARLGTVRVRTPSPALDLMMNGWLVYQNLSCRMWARSAYYQSGGAFGFRDQLQDSSALLYVDPAITRQQILLHAAHQFVEGDVLHWWHPPLSKGIRTRFSDDLLWLPYVTAFYIASTGDDAVLDEQVRYLTGPLLADGDDEEFMIPRDAGVNASLYDHCCRALDRSLTRGAHGLPLIGVGDWNDGMNRVGREGRGESVWLAFFLYDILNDFIPIAEARGDHDRADRYGDYRAGLQVAVNDAGWDGAWYCRAFYDNGEPLGSAHSDECRIDALAQAWAVLSGAAPADRAARALDALENHLVAETDGIIRLLTPAFDRTPNDPGYIKGYLPGVRENGGQYTHGVLWAVRALAECARTERAARLLEMLTPVLHGDTPEHAARYMVEPYVVAADVYGEAPHVGRGGWTWYTGSAGWMYRIGLESILGLQLRRGSELVLRPCVPAAWPGYEISYRLPDATTYTIHVERIAGSSSIIADGETAGTVADGAIVIPIVRDGSTHDVRVRLGPDVGPRYESR